MAEIRLEDLHKIHPNGAVAVQGLELAVQDGELVVLVGPSGCGKTTVLRLVAGLEEPSRGRVWIDGRDVTALPPQARDVAMVFQSYALYPHKSVRDNLAFGLRMRRLAREEIVRRVEGVAATLGLAELLERRPAQLSGGQRQRVALGRAMVREPKAFLLDEPLSNLDARLRAETRAELGRLHRRLAATMLYVTHDQEEAMTLADRLVVLRNGAVQQVGAPLAVHDRPANAFVAGFIGAPAMNLLPGEREGSGGLVRGRGFRVQPAPRQAPRTLWVGVRPVHVVLGPSGSGEGEARVELVEPLGSSALVHARLADEGETVRVLLGAAERLPRLGEAVALHLRKEFLHWFDARDGSRIEA